MADINCIDNCKKNINWEYAKLGSQELGWSRVGL